MNHNVFFITTIDVIKKENKAFTWRTPGFRYSLEDAKAVVEKYLPITTDATIEILNEMFGGKIVEIG